MNAYMYKFAYKYTYISVFVIFLLSVNLEAYFILQKLVVIRGSLFIQKQRLLHSYYLFENICCHMTVEQ
jgi:hypothetical protein